MNEKDFKCLLVHTPQFYKKTAELSEAAHLDVCGNLNDDTQGLYSTVNFCAMGLYSLAGEIEKEGFGAEILHLGVEKYLDKTFSLSKYVKENDVKFVAFSLHWHPQSYSVIEEARKLKTDCPGVFIALGGFSASYFASEILKEFPFIDAIIQGEGEKPVRELTKAVYDGLFSDAAHTDTGCAFKSIDFSNISNLAWKTGGKIFLNPKTYVSSGKELDTFEFFNIKRMKNFEHYAKIPFVLNYSNRENLEELNNPMTSQGVCLGRGCFGNCTWCGGGYRAMKIVTGRDFLSYRSAKSVIEEIKTLKKDCGIEVFRFAFDPNPKDRTHLMDLMQKLYEEFGGNLTAAFSLFSLPDKEFLNLYAKTFSKDSIISISPEFQNEALRRRHKAFYFSNKELEEALRVMDELQIASELYFSIIPGVSDAECEKSKKYGEFLQKKFEFVKEYFIIPIIFEPASPWTLCPERYGLKNKGGGEAEDFNGVLVPEKFMDYYNDTKNYYWNLAKV